MKLLHKIFLRFSTYILLVTAGYLLSGCNTKTDAVTNVAEENSDAVQQAGIDAVDQAPEVKKPEIKNEASNVSKKGTTIRALVNGEPITNYDINRRIAFMKLRRSKGANFENARNELIDETIKMQEARARRTRAPDAQVNEAFNGFAKSNRMTNAQLTQVLNGSGVTKAHFKEFIRGQISWNRTVGAKLRSENRQQSTEKTMFDLRKSGEEKPQTNEYILQQVIFVIPQNKRTTIMKQRKAQANAFRKLYQNCETTSKIAVGQLDVSVRNLPRILEPELPPEWKEQVIKTPVNGTTDIQETSKGVEFLAVCSKNVVSHDKAAAIVKQSQKFEDLNKKGDELSKEFLNELKAKSKIVYR